MRPWTVFSWTCSWRATASRPGEIVLDLDATDDPIHGHQEGRFIHGYYDPPCFLPFFIICGEHIMRANQLRMYFSAFAGAIVRRVGLRGTACARWRVDTLRSRLFKLAGRLNRTVRRIRLCLASTFPLQDVFARTLVNLRAAAQAPPG